MSKVSHFHKLLDRGYSVEDARVEAGIGKNTAATQYSKWKKSKEEPASQSGITQTEEGAPEEDDEEEGDTFKVEGY